MATSFLKASERVCPEGGFAGKTDCIQKAAVLK